MTHLISIRFFNKPRELFLITTEPEIIVTLDEIRNEILSAYTWLQTTEEGHKYANKYGKTYETIVQKACEENYWEYQPTNIELDMRLLRKEGFGDAD